MRGTRCPVRYVLRGRRLHPRRERAGGPVPATGCTPIVSDPLTTDDRGHVEYTFTGVGPLPAGTYQAAAVEGSSRATLARSNDGRGRPDTHGAAMPDTRSRSTRTARRPAATGPLRRDRDRHRLRVRHRRCSPGTSVAPRRSSPSRRSATTASSACASTLGSVPRAVASGSASPRPSRSSRVGQERSAARAQRHRERPATCGASDLPGALPTDGDTGHDPRSRL